MFPVTKHRVKGLGQGGIGLGRNGYPIPCTGSWRNGGGHIGYIGDKPYIWDYCTNVPYTGDCTMFNEEAKGVKLSSSACDTSETLEVMLDGIQVGVLISVLVVTGWAAFQDRGAAPPFRPRPLGMLVVRKLVTFAFLLFFADRNCGNFLLTSATATLCEQIPMDFQLEQFKLQLKSSPFFGVTT